MLDGVLAMVTSCFCASVMICFVPGRERVKLGWIYISSRRDCPLCLGSMYAWENKRITVDTLLECHWQLWSGLLIRFSDAKSTNDTKGT